jgi:hypothetical protein
MREDAAEINSLSAELTDLKKLHDGNIFKVCHERARRLLQRRKP